MDAKPSKKKLADQLLGVLNNPVQLRIVLAAAVFGTWYFGFCSGVGTEIDDHTKATAREARRLKLACDIERLRDQLGRFQKRMPENTDPNEWVQYMLGGIRKLPIKLIMIDTDAPKEVGPYRVIPVRMEVEGRFGGVDAFLRWLETNERLLRIDSVKLEPTKSGHGFLKASCIVMGVMG